jgi:hypothetical protein
MLATRLVHIMFINYVNMFTLLLITICYLEATFVQIQRANLICMHKAEISFLNLNFERMQDVSDIHSRRL